MLIAVIPLSIMGYGVYRTAQNVVIGSAYMHIETIAQDHANHLDTWFGERINDLHIISELPFVRDLCKVYCETGKVDLAMFERPGLVDNILALTRGKSRSYKNVHIFSPSGTILASTDPNAEEVPLHDHRVLFDTVEATGAPLLGPVHQHGDKRWYMDLAAPIRIAENKTVALLVAVLDVSATLDPIMTDHAGLGKTGETYLVNKEGRIITESRFLGRPETVVRSFDSFGIRAALSEKNGTEIYRNYTEQEVIGSYAWLPRYGWGLLVEMQKEEILAPIKRIRTAVVATAVGVGLLCILLSFVMTRRVSKPIIDVAEASREIAEGRFERRISVSGIDEVGILSKSFNSMAEDLSCMVESLCLKETSLKKAYEELVQTQEQLVQSEKMAVVGELVMSVVHELRNPLSSVKLNLQILGRTLEEGSVLSVHHEIAIDQVSQLDRMLTDLLNFSKPLTLEKVEVRVEELVEESIEQLVSLIIEQRIDIVKELDSSLPPIHADPGRMRQVLVNLLKNAMEATGKDGTVKVSARVEGSNGKSKVLLCICDNGPGIAPYDLARIFQPFFTTKKKGTGLGLCTVRKIIEAHGFAISVSSEEGSGTMVELEIS